jgi:GNAT superfamily N-acetyltransferase
MSVEIREESIGSLSEYANISIAFRVDKILEVSVLEGGLGGVMLEERQAETSYVKDYDESEHHPTQWRERFNVANWGVIAAHEGSLRVGGATIAFNTDSLDVLDGRSDLAVLWDLRVRPERRGAGIGSLLFQAAENWALGCGCKQLKTETQNVNVPACRFYAGMGCVLGGINRYAYSEHPEETQLLWFKDL